MDARLARRLFLVAATAFATWLPSSAAAQTWVNVTGNLANMPSECGNLYHLSAEPATARVIAGVALRGLWANSSGSTWAALGTGAGSDAITNRPTWIAYDPATPSTFWESGIYNGGGVYKTVDGGVTFHRLGSISHNDYVSVDFSDPARQVLLAGGHEQSRTVFRSANGGQSWTNIGSTLPANTKFSVIPLALASNTYLVNSAGYGAGVGGIFRTSDGGASWQQVSGFEASAPPLVSNSGAIYWPMSSGLVRSIDGGMTWTEIGRGLLTGFYGITPAELPDGRLVAVGHTRLLVSADRGSTWTELGPQLPYTPNALVYSSGQRAFFISRWDCGGVVPPNAIMRFDFEALPPPLPGAPTNLRIVPQSGAASAQH